MPAFMSIGKEEDQWVDPGDIKGDVSGVYHTDWIKILSFSVDMKDEERSAKWDALQDSIGARRARRESNEEDSSDQKETRQNVLNVSKRLDLSSAGILEWAKSSVLHDVQIDCCSMEEDWPFLTFIFLGVQPSRSSIDDESSESLTLTWKKALVFTWEFDESGEPRATDFAEFGEESASAVTTAAQRGLSDYVPPAPNPNQGAGRGAATTHLNAALTGGLPPVEAETKSYDQERRTITIEKVGQLEFDIDSFRVEEGLSRLFVYDIELRSELLKVDPKDIIGHDLSFAIEDEEGREDNPREPRYFSGVIANLLVGEMASDRRRTYHAVVLPTLWKLTQRSNCRVFQEKSVKEIVEKVFGDAKFSDYDFQSVTRQHPPLPYCVQYHETDFAFVSRLLEDAGIFYFFKHEKGKHTLMLCDGPSGYVKCPEDPLEFNWDVHSEPRMTSWRRHFAFVPGKFDSRDFNFETPREPVKAQAQTRIDLPGIKDAEIFEYPGHFADADQGTTVADRRLQEREVGHHFVHAVGCYDSVVPGMTIAVEGLPGEDPSGDSATKRYLVTAIRHQAEQLPEYGVSIVGYRNILTCIPEETPFTPPRITPKPVVHGPQTAVVVGDKETEEDVVDTDKYGRVKVQFHWDREGKKDKDSSCWMRVLQPTAGAAWGSMVIPRIGTEVVVGFLDGDPDRPIVLGSVPNELHLPHHELPAAKYKSVMMSRSFPGGGKDNFNELTFHDEKDKEEVYFHAERDFKRVVEHDDVLEVGEKEDGGQTITIEGDQSITINKGNRTLKVAKGTETITVKGDRTVTIESGNQKIDVSAGKCQISAAQEIELKVGGSSIKISASGIELKVGGSSLKVDNAGVASKGMTVKAEGSIQAEVKGMMVSISADAMLQTKGGITMMQ